MAVVVLRWSHGAHSRKTEQPCSGGQGRPPARVSPARTDLPGDPRQRREATSAARGFDLRARPAEPGGGGRACRSSRALRVDRRLPAGRGLAEARARHGGRGGATARRGGGAVPDTSAAGVAAALADGAGLAAVGTRRAPRRQPGETGGADGPLDKLGVPATRPGPRPTRTGPRSGTQGATLPVWRHAASRSFGARQTERLREAR